LEALIAVLAEIEDSFSRGGHGGKAHEFEEQMAIWARSLIKATKNIPNFLTSEEEIWKECESLIKWFRQRPDDSFRRVRTAAQLAEFVGRAIDRQNRSS
jgi:hypothetical protein